MSVTPRLVVSRCLGFEACRYNGEMLQDAVVQRLRAHVQLITVCPEADIGLGTPRPPVRLVQAGDALRLWQPASGEDVSERMQQWIGSTDFSHVDGFILKSRSPSCGLGDCKIYPDTSDDARPVGKGSGLFAAAMQQAFPHAAMEHEGRLSNASIREWFLVRLFALARARGLLEQPSVAAVSTFHARHKLLLMCFHQQDMRRCGRIAANTDNKPVAKLAADYVQAFRQTLAQEASRKNIINALYHGYGWISEGLNAAEKQMFLEAIEAYRDDKATLATLQWLLQSWVHRFEHDYLGSQFFIRPYPDDLKNLSDSGRRRQV